MARLPFHDDAPFFTALEAAAHLLHIASDRGGSLNHRQLQNLLYYAQGFSQFSLEKLLFPDPIEARRDGPVVEVVEGKYAGHGDGPIPAPDNFELNEWSILAKTTVSAVHLELGTVACDQMTERLISQSPWLEALAASGVVDPSAVARWWQDWYDERQALRAPRESIKLTDYLEGRPDIAERLRHPGADTEYQLLR